jgi:dsDNA-binding SOS-regulon protein
MTTHFAELARRAAADRSVSPEEVLELRRQGWGDGVIHKDEAEALFALNNALEDRSEEWVDFFVEAIGEFVLNGTPPRLQCSREEAQWLIAQVDHDGVVESMAELEAIVRIIERAENVPVLLKDYVLAQVEREVLTGTGPTRCGGELSATHISAAECRIIRRVIFASGGHGPAAVSRFDAEMLFRLKDETLAEENAAEWDDLFLDGVANYLKGFTLQNAQLSHERKQELNAFIADNKANVGRFFGRMVKEAPSVANSMGVVFGKRKTGPDYTALEAAGNAVTDAEQEWLEAMIDADGEVDELESRLLARIAAGD